MKNIHPKYTSLYHLIYICLFLLYSSAPYAVQQVTTEFMDVDGEPVPEHEAEPARDVYEQDTIIDEEVYSY